VRNDTLCTRHKNVESTPPRRRARAQGFCLIERTSLMCHNSDSVTQIPEFAFRRLFPRLMNLIGFKGAYSGYTETER